MADYGAILAFFLLGGVEIAIGLLISSLTESQVIAAVGTFGLLLLLYLWTAWWAFLPSTAVGPCWAFVVLILVCFLINALSNNWKITAACVVAGSRGADRLYLRDLRLRQPAAGCAGPFSLPPSTGVFPILTTASTCRSCCTCPLISAAGLSDRPGHPEAAVELRGGVEHGTYGLENSLREAAGATPAGAPSPPD